MDREQVMYQLKVDHYDHVHNWAGIEAIIEKVSRHTQCSVDDLREMMREIEVKHPKPKKKRAWRNIEFKKPCRTCGRVIGFSRTDKGNLMPVNLDDFTTHWACEKPGKPKKK